MELNIKQKSKKKNITKLREMTVRSSEKWLWGMWVSTGSQAAAAEQAGPQRPPPLTTRLQRTASLY